MLPELQNTYISRYCSRDCIHKLPCGKAKGPLAYAGDNIYRVPNCNSEVEVAWSVGPGCLVGFWNKIIGIESDQSVNWCSDQE